MSPGVRQSIVVVFVLAAFAPPARADVVHVATVVDGASAFTDSVRTAFEREIASYFGRGQVVDFPERYAVAGDWTPQSAAAAIDRLFASKDVDIIVALGPASS